MTLTLEPGSIGFLAEPNSSDWQVMVDAEEKDEVTIVSWASDEGFDDWEFPRRGLALSHTFAPDTPEYDLALAFITSWQMGHPNTDLITRLKGLLS